MKDFEFDVLDFFLLYYADDKFIFSEIYQGLKH